MKLGPHLFVMLGALCLGGLTTSCGYRSVYADSERSERYVVVSGETLVPELTAVDGILAGARAELSREGALQPGNGYPRVVIDVLRVDEQSSGIAAAQGQGRDVPLARGSSVGVVARAWTQRAADLPPERDSGDMRRVEHYASGADAATDRTSRAEAVRSAAHALGRALARRILSEPEPEYEAL